MDRIETYLDEVSKTDKEYHWVIDDYENSKDKRIKIHEEFPYVVTLDENWYDLRPVNKWCTDQFGLQHGLCRDSQCQYGEIDEEGYEKLIKELIKEFGKKSLDEDPEEKWVYKHSHWGKWNGHYALKTGYDSGFCDYCFKNKEDAMYFKIIWYK